MKREPANAATRRSFLGVAGAAGIAIPTRTAFQLSGSTPATLAVDLSATPFAFDRMIFGQFLEHFHRQVYGGVFEPGSPLSDADGFRKDVVAALRELRVPVVRWPGGCFVSSYHWKDGVGPQRQASFDKAWGVEDPNTFGTDEYVKWCRAIGAAPYICTNAGTGTMEEMSDWVEYCNLKEQGRYARQRRANGAAEPHNVRFWSVGNENYGAWEIGARTVAEWGPLVRESAKMMRAVDKNIQLLAAATTNREWTVPLLEQAGRYLDYISIHGYWDPLWEKNDLSGYLPCMMRTEEPEQAIADAIQLLEKTGHKDRIKIAFDEWNLRGWHHPGFPGGGTQAELIARRAENDRNESYTMADAVFSASFLNACLRRARFVKMACMAPVVNARGPLFVHPKGIVRRTTYHVLRMYAELLEANVAGGRSESAPLESGGKSVASVDTLVTCSDDRKRLAIALVNRHPERTLPCGLRIAGLGGEPKISATVLSGDSPDAYNDVPRPDRVVPQTREYTLKGGRIELPPHSVTIARVGL